MYIIQYSLLIFIKKMYFSQGKGLSDSEIKEKMDQQRIQIKNMQQQIIKNIQNFMNQVPFCIREVPTRIRIIKNCFGELESQLYNFFQFISIGSNKAKIIIPNCEDNVIDIDKNETKLIINYYDIIEVEVYVDLTRPFNEIIPKIFAQIFYPNLIKKRYKRTKRTQTTEYIMSHPIKESDEEKSFYIYKNFLYLESGGISLEEILKNSNTIIRIKNGDTINLKLSQEFYDEINTFPKNGNINIKLNSQRFANYPISANMKYEQFKKIINFNYFQNTNDNNYPNLDFITGQNVSGGGNEINGPLMFVDPNNSSLKQLKLSKNPPKWRTVKRGLNLFGKCQNKNCQASGKEVIYKTYQDNRKINLPEEGIIFDMVEELNKIKCPICKKIFRPTTCGFFKCEYQFIGDKLKKGDEVHYDSKTRETKEDKIEYYNPKKEDKTEWFKLKIYVLPFQKIKYNSK